MVPEGDRGLQNCRGARVGKEGTGRGAGREGVAEMKPYTTNDFRKELLKVMPGYKWTVHREFNMGSVYMTALGIQTSGFNRLSTLEVVRREKDGATNYTVRSSGYGVKAPWLGEYVYSTLARALRGLQNHYERMGREYLSHASRLENGRKTPP